MARYRNRALKHRTWQIVMDGTQKLPQRWLDSIRWHLRESSDFTLLALGIAGWMRYVGGVDEQVQPIDISDPLKESLAKRMAQPSDNEERVRALLSLQTVFGDDLPADARFVELVNRYYQQLQAQGAKATIAALIATLD